MAWKLLERRKLVFTCDHFNMNFYISIVTLVRSIWKSRTMKNFSKKSKDFEKLKSWYEKSDTVLWCILPLYISAENFIQLSPTVSKIFGVSRYTPCGTATKWFLTLNKNKIVPKKHSFLHFSDKSFPLVCKKWNNQSLFDWVFKNITIQKSIFCKFYRSPLKFFFFLNDNILETVSPNAPKKNESKLEGRVSHEIAIKCVYLTQVLNNGLVVKLQSHLFLHFLDTFQLKVLREHQSKWPDLDVKNFLIDDTLNWYPVCGVYFQ